MDLLTGEDYGEEFTPLGTCKGLLLLGCAVLLCGGILGFLLFLAVR